MGRVGRVLVCYGSGGTSLSGLGVTLGESYCVRGRSMGDIRCIWNHL